MPKNEKKSFFTEEERKLLEPKYYPLEKEAKYFFDYYYKFKDDSELNSVQLLQRRMLTEFGRFVENSEAPIPVKEDVIQFIFIKRNDYTLDELLIGSALISEFIKYCEKNIHLICERAFEDKDVKRTVKLKGDKIPYSSYSTIKDIVPDLDELITKYEKLTKGEKKHA